MGSGTLEADSFSRAPKEAYRRGRCRGL